MCHPFLLAFISSEQHHKGLEKYHKYFISILLIPLQHTYGTPSSSYFVAVAEAENTRGRTLTYCPARTEMQQLEEELECVLFDRLPRGIRLNAAGKAFLESARDILSRTDEAVAHARRVAQPALDS